MSNNKQQVFVNGLRIFPPSGRTPAWVKGSLLINKSELMNWLDSQKDNEIRIDIKESKSGDKWYTSVSDFKPGPREERQKPGISGFPPGYDNSTEVLPF